MLVTDKLWKHRKYMCKNECIKVWDLFVRISHWSLVLIVLIAFLSGDEKNPIHIYAGYTILAIISLRFVWGFIGGKHARFTNFIYSPSLAVEYIKQLLKREPKYYVGHNPAAGWMVILLLIFLAVVCATGHMAYKFKGQGISVQNFSIIKYAYADSDDDDEYEHEDEPEENEFWEDIHEGTASALLILIFLHVSGALLSSKLHNENLVMAMITGKKEKKA
jgi:cytochrome b